MFPDLRLLISATVATFFLAATAGLYASLRITQDQIPARTDGRTAIEETPATRIAMGWPSAEPGRAAALRDLAKIATHPPIVARAPETEPETEPDRSDSEAAQETTQSMPPPSEMQSHAALSESRAQDAIGSTGIAAQPEPAAVNQSDHPDIHGNIDDVAALPKDDAGAEKNIRRAAIPTVVVPRKKTVKVQRRKKTARVPEVFPDPLTAGYPLYLTVPVFN